MICLVSITIFSGNKMSLRKTKSRPAVSPQLTSVQKARPESDVTKMLKLKHDNYALERIRIEQIVVTERYSRDTAQWDKMRALWHPRDEQTSIKITWFNGTIDGHIDGSKAMAQKSGLTGVKHAILPVDVTRNILQEYL